MHRCRLPAPAPCALPRRLLACALGVAAVGLSGCQNITANTPEAAEIRMVDTSVDAPPMDLYLNGTGTAYNLGYGTFSSYIPVTPGATQVTENRASTGQVLVATRGVLAVAHAYTAVIGSRLGSLQATVFPDAAPAAVPGTFALRILNAADGGGPLDVYLTSGVAGSVVTTLLVRNLAAMADSGYSHVPVGSGYALLAVPAGAAPTAANAVNGSLVVSGGNGAQHTVVLSEARRGEGRRVTGFVLDDGPTS